MLSRYTSAQCHLTREDHFKGSLMGFGCVPEPKWHVFVPVRAKICRESCIATIAHLYLDLPVAAFRIYWVEHLRLAKRFSALIHAWEWIGITERDCVSLSVINTKA